MTINETLPATAANTTLDRTEDSKPQPPVDSGSTLQSRNVRIHKRRTSVRLEPEMWSALNEIAMMENCSIHDLCGAVYDLKESAASFTAALRVFMMEYYRSASRTNPQVSDVQKQLKLNRAGGKEAFKSRVPFQGTSGGGGF